MIRLVSFLPSSHSPPWVAVFRKKDQNFLVLLSGDFKEHFSQAIICLKSSSSSTTTTTVRRRSSSATSSLTTTSRRRRRGENGSTEWSQGEKVASELNHQELSSWNHCNSPESGKWKSSSSSRPDIHYFILSFRILPKPFSSSSRSFLLQSWWCPSWLILFRELPASLTRWATLRLLSSLHYVRHQESQVVSSSRTRGLSPNSGSVS